MNHRLRSLGSLFCLCLALAANLPAAPAPPKPLPPYRRMDMGPALFWTLQVAPGNIAQKGIAIRVDDGPGGAKEG